LPDRRVVGQTVETILFQQVRNTLILLRFLIEEPQSRIVRSQVRLALYRNSDVGEIDGQTLASTRTVASRSR
jgi:hypothetical protein